MAHVNLLYERRNISNKYSPAYLKIIGASLIKNQSKQIRQLQNKIILFWREMEISKHFLHLIIRLAGPV